MKTKEELDALKEELRLLSAKLNELNDDELKEVASGCKGLIPDDYINSSSTGTVVMHDMPRKNEDEKYVM